MSLFLITPDAANGGEDYDMLVAADSPVEACKIYRERLGDQPVGAFVQVDDGVPARNAMGESDLFVARQLPEACSGKGMIDWDHVPITFWREVPALELSAEQSTVRKFLDLSTAHLTFETAQSMEDGYAPSTLYGHPDGCGWFMHVPSEEHLAGLHTVWADLRAIIDKARALGCDYINLDRDADKCRGLPVYEWDEERRAREQAWKFGWRRDALDGVIRNAQSGSPAEYVGWVECCEETEISFTSELKT